MARRKKLHPLTIDKLEYLRERDFNAFRTMLNLLDRLVENAKAGTAGEAVR